MESFRRKLARTFQFINKMIIVSNADVSTVLNWAAEIECFTDL